MKPNVEESRESSAPHIGVFALLLGASVVALLLIGLNKVSLLAHLPPASAAHRACLPLVEVAEPGGTLLDVVKQESAMGWSLRYELRRADYAGERVLRCNSGPDGQDARLDTF